MARCPVCGSEIEYLKNYVKAEKVYYFDGERSSTILLEKDGEFECPECNEVLFTDEDSARRFLKSGVIE